MSGEEITNIEQEMWNVEVRPGNAALLRYSTLPVEYSLLG
jgi:hypothetical protein